MEHFWVLLQLNLEVFALRFHIISNSYFPDSKYFCNMSDKTYCFNINFATVYIDLYQRNVLPKINPFCKYMVLRLVNLSFLSYFQWILVDYIYWTTPNIYRRSGWKLIPCKVEFLGFADRGRHWCNITVCYHR